jgi:uncharacterized protein YqcC (DUF446 family)
MKNQPRYPLVSAKLDEIEAELKRIDWWSADPPSPEAMQFTQAFGMDTLSFDQWLQFVLLPNVRQIIAAHGKFPRTSEVGAYATRELDTAPGAETLIRLLSEFDDLFS